MSVRTFRHDCQYVSRATALRLVPIFLVIFIALAPRPAQAMQALMADMLTPYQSPVSKLDKNCALCHADWNGRETRNNLGVAYYIFGSTTTNSTTSIFALLDPDKDGINTTTELTNSQSANLPSNSTRWMPGLPDKDGDGCVNLYSRSDENGMPLVATTIVSYGYVNGPQGPITYGPKGWDIDDNDSGQGCNTMTAWPTNATPGSTFTTPGSTTDSTAPGQITNLRASSLASGQLPLTWTAVADDGTSGVAAYEYDLRYTTESLALAKSTCGGGSSPCKVRLATDWSLMWDQADSDIDNTLGYYLGKSGGTLTSALGAWNSGAANTPLMRALYEPLPGSPSATETFTIQTTGIAHPTNVITNGITYWLSIRTGDGVLKPTHVETPTGFAENISSVSNIVAITAGSSGAAISSYSNNNGLPINNVLANAITVNGYGLDSTNAAKMVLVNTSGTVIATAATVSYSGSTAATATFYCPVAAGTYTLEARTSGDVIKAAWVDAVTVTSNTSCRSAYNTSGSAGNANVTLNWTTSAATDFHSTVILRWAGSSVGTEVPANSTTYLVNNTISTATVACVDNTTTSSTALSGRINGTGGTAQCSTTALTSGTYYSYKIFQKYDDGTYDAGVLMSGSPYLPLGTTITSAATGNWNAGATWVGGVVPTSINPVVITSTHVVTVTATAASYNLTFTTASDNSSLNLNSGIAFTTGDIVINLPSTNGRDATLAVGAGTLTATSLALHGNTGERTHLTISTGTATISGDIVTASTDGLVTFSGAGTLNAGGTFMSGAAGTFTASTGTVNFTGSSAQVISPFAYTFNNVGISGAGTKTLGIATTVGGNLTVSSGSTLDVGAFNFTATGTTGVTGTLTHSSTTGTKQYTGLVTINSGGVWNNSANAAINFRGGLTNNGTFAAGTGLYTFNTNHQAIGGVATSIPNMTVLLLADAVTPAVLTNNITATGGLTVSTSLAGTGNFSQGTNAILTYGSATAPTVTTFTVNTNGSKVDYSAASPAMRVTNYHHLIFSGSGTATGAVTTVAGDFIMSGSSGAAYTTAAALAINGNVDVYPGNTLTVGAFNMTVTGTTTVDGTLTHSSTTGTKQYTGLVTVSTNGVWNNSANAAINFRGGLTNNGTFTAGSGLYTFDTNAQAIGGTAATTIPSMTTAIVLTNNISSSTGLTVSTALEGAGTFTQGSNAMLTYTATAVPAVTTLTASASGNTVNYSGSAQTIKLPSGSPAIYFHLTLSTSGTKTLPATAMTVSGNLTLSGTASTTAAAALTVTGNVVIGSGTTLDGSTFTHNVAGNWSNAGTFTASTSTITLNGTNQTITGSNTFFNLSKSVSSAATLTVAASSTQTISGLVTLAGAASNLLSLRSSVSGTAWSIRVNGTKSFNYLDVKDSDASGSSVTKPFNPANSVNSGNTVDWFAAISLTITKASAVISDPSNGTTNPKRIPGAVIEYTITAANTGGGNPDVNTVYISDPLDSGKLSYYVTGGVTFAQGATTSALALGTVTYSNTASPGPYVYTYTPLADGDGYDSTVTSIKATTTGTFAFGGSPVPSFTLTFRTKVK